VDLEGRTLRSKYEVVALVGEGGMGTVWSARHAVTGRKLAIKVLDERFLGNEAVVQRFGREARAASAIQHPGIVEVLDLDSTDEGVPFLVMEFLEGETLGQRIAKRGRLDQEEAVRIFRSLLEALAAAHAHGVVHRDLKPDNIHLVPAGRSGEAVKILDFGISQKADETAQQKLTVVGSVLGTPHYMSPEQALGEKSVDFRSDLYAAGVVLYECVVGDVPFNATNYNRLLRIILDETPEPPVSRGAQITPEVERLILWAVEKDRELRIPSAKEMLRWLDRAEAGEMPPYEPPPSGQPWRKPKVQSTRPPADAEPTEEPVPEAAEALAAPAADGMAFDDFEASVLATPPPVSLRPNAPPSPVPPPPSPVPPPPSPVPPRRDSTPGFDAFALSGEIQRGSEIDIEGGYHGGSDMPAAVDDAPEDGFALELDESALVRTSTTDAKRVSGEHPAVQGRRPVTGTLSTIRPGPLPGTDPPPAPKPKRELTEGQRLALLGGAGVILVVLVIVFIRVFLDPQPPPLPEEPPGAAEALPEAPNPPEGGEDPERPAADRVTIRVRGLPPGHHVMLDGLPDDGTLRLRRGSRHVLEISAPGYVSRRIELLADRDRTIDANLQIQ
jgi:serine/threonine protein kinase